MDLLISILNIAIFQGFILALLILRSPLFKSQANNFLAYSMITLSVSLLNFVLDEMGLYQRYDPLQIIDIIDSSVLFPVLLFFYFIHYVDHPFRRSNKRYWLFLPYFLSVFSSILNTITNNGGIITVFFELVNLLLSFLFIPAILFACYRLIKSITQRPEKRWLQSLWLLSSILFISWLLLILTSIIFGLELTYSMKALTVVVVLLFHWVSYYGIYKFKLAKDQAAIRQFFKDQTSKTQEKPKVPLTVPEEKAYKKSMTADNSYYIQLIKLCEEDHIYKDQSLDRNKTAALLGISPSYVSQMINSVSSENFTTFINRYRVEAIKKIIVNPAFEHYSLLAIGLECGFSSKTTFHNAFKKFTGMTPNAFKKSHQ